MCITSHPFFIGRRVFAREKSATSTSLSSAATSLLGSREDLTSAAGILGSRNDLTRLKGDGPASNTNTFND